MGFLDNVLNGLGDDAAGGLGDLLKGQGGVGGLAEKFGQAAWAMSSAPGSARAPTSESRLNRSRPSSVTVLSRTWPESWASRPNRPARPWPACCPKPSTG